MASTAALNSGDPITGFALPVPPQQLHARSGSDKNGLPRTPTDSEPAFISPVQTPQGSPSKNKQPPGAFDLPDVFSNAMKLFPTIGSPNKAPKQQTPGSPNKGNAQSDKKDERFDHAERDATAGAPGSPTRKANKENTPPTRPNLPKDTSFVNQAALSRQDPYAQRPASPTRQKSSQAPTPEELEKLQKPSVKRLANVTQLCMATTFTNR